VAAVFSFGVCAPRSDIQMEPTRRLSRAIRHHGARSFGALGQQPREPNEASVLVGTSLDGFIARPNGELHFLHVSGGEAHGYDEFHCHCGRAGRRTQDV
jgi:hypothetical protein